MLAATSVEAQTLDAAGNTPIVGGVFPMHADGYVDPGAAGTGVFWDFSTLGTDSLVTYQVISSDVSAHFALFPNADYAITNSTSDTLFYEATANGLELDGEDVTFVAFDVQVPYTDNMLALKLPCTLGANWTDNLSADYDIDGIGAASRLGTITGDADATGTVLMPYGELPALLRVHTRQQLFDDVVVSQATRERDEWAWYGEWSKFPVLRIWADTIAVTFPPITQIVQMTEWMDSAAAVGLHDPTGDAFGLEAFPNPTTGHVTLTFGAFDRKEMNVVVNDAMGRVVMRERLGDLSTGFHQFVLDVSALPAGCYQVVLSDATGLRSVLRLARE